MPALNLSNITSKIPNTATFTLVGLERSVSKRSMRTTRNMEKDIHFNKQVKHKPHNLVIGRIFGNIIKFIDLSASLSNCRFFKIKYKTLGGTL